MHTTKRRMLVGKTMTVINICLKSMMMKIRRVLMKLINYSHSCYSVLKARNILNLNTLSVCLLDSSSTLHCCILFLEEIELTKAVEKDFARGLLIITDDDLEEVR